MKDQEFLWWLHERLVSVHGEDENLDFMWKLRNIIAKYDQDKITPNTCCTKVEDIIEKVFGRTLDKKE